MKRFYVGLSVFIAAALPAASAQAESRGEQIFRQKCAMCHVVKGKGGQIGPELTKMASGTRKIDLKAQLESPKKLNPTTTMPSFRTLPKNDMDALLAYLKTLK
jgi:mono/diheme cytochrome c family protein